MKSENIKLLPLLVVVAMLAFSVRIADVATGMSTLGKSAHAASEKKESNKKEKTDDHGDDHTGTDKDKAEEKESMALKEDVKRPAPIKIAEIDEAGEPEGDWRDPADEDFEYGSVKLEVFDDLSNRRKSLDKREKGLTTREALLKAAEQELDRKYQELSHLRTQIEGLLKQQSTEEEARIGSLVKIYEGMKPKDAARIFDTLDLDVLVSVMSRMSERKLSPVLAAMNAERARTVTIMLAEQKQLPKLPQAN